MQTLHFYETRHKTIRFDEPDTFRYRPEKGWKWLQRLCCYILSKLGAINTRIEDKVERIDIDERDFMAAFMKQHNEAMKYCQYEPERVYMGKVDFCEFAKHPDFNYLSPINLTVEHRVGYNGISSILGMKITVIPWMKGVLIVPKGRD